jgi:hypothetical protein
MIELALLLPLAVLLVRFLKVQSPFTITHLDLFNLGFFVYVSVPIVLSLSTALRNLPLVEQWQMIAGGIAGAQLQWMAGFAIACWAAFHAGVATGALTGKVGAASPSAARLAQAPEHKAVLTSTIALLASALLAFVFVHTYLHRELLFAGYSDREYSETARGPLQLAMLLVSYLMAFGLERREQVGRGVLVFAGAVLLAIVVDSLSMGTRQGVVTLLLGGVVFWSRFQGGISRSRFLIFGACVLFLLALVGIWRLSQGSGLFLTALLEPLLNFLSALTLMGFNEIPAFALPDELLHGLLNLIPSSLWAGKSEYFATQAQDLMFIAPLGGQHFFASTISAFGWCGTLMMLFVVGLLIHRFALGAYQTRRIATYAVLASVLGMDMWRNPLQITAVKICIQVGVLWPVVIHLVSKAMTWYLTPYLQDAPKRRIDSQVNLS